MRSLALATLFLALALPADGLPPLGEESPFNSTEWSSEAVAVAWSSCVRVAKRSSGRERAVIYCFCATDEVRADVMGTPSTADLAACAQPFASGEGGLLLSGWHTDRIVRAISTCEARVGDSLSSLIGTNGRWSYCACLVDAERERFGDGPSASDAETCIVRARDRYGAK